GMEHLYRCLRRLALVAAVDTDKTEIESVNVSRDMVEQDYAILLTAAAPRSIPASVWRTSHLIYLYPQKGTKNTKKKEQMALNTASEVSVASAYSRSTIILIGLCFVLSGATGLIYEVLWARMLGLVFGATTLAVSTVLAAFMGGLALGSALAGKFAQRIRKPL